MASACARCCCATRGGAPTMARWSAGAARRDTRLLCSPAVAADVGCGIPPRPLGHGRQSGCRRDRPPRGDGLPPDAAERRRRCRARSFLRSRRRTRIDDDHCRRGADRRGCRAVAGRNGLSLRNGGAARRERAGIGGGHRARARGTRRRGVRPDQGYHAAASARAGSRRRCSRL